MSRLGLAIALAACVPAAVEGTLYGLVDSGLVSISISNGTCTPIGTIPSSELQAQQLSAVDGTRGLMYIVGFNATSEQPNLVSLWLSNGTIASTVPLNFYEEDFVGVGQALAVDASGRLILGAQRSANGPHLVGYVDPTSGNFTQVASLSPTLQDSLGEVVAYDPSLDAVVLSFTSADGADELVAVTMKDGNISRTFVDNYDDGQNLQAIAGFDVASHSLVGLGISPGAVARTVVLLDAATFNLTVVGNISGYLLELGPIATLDESSRILYWMGAPSDAGRNAGVQALQGRPRNATTPAARDRQGPKDTWYVIGVNIGTASVTSAGELDCEPWSLHFVV